MLRKTVVLGSVLTAVCASSTLAHSPFYKSGFMAGAHLGLSVGSGSFSTNFNTNLPGVPQFPASGRGRKTSGMFGIMGGYRQIVNQDFTVGFDISANVFTNSELSKRLTYDMNTYTFTNKLSRRYSIIPNISLGKIFCNRWHVALGLGLGIAGFRQKVDFLTNGTTASSSTTKLGFVPSLGVEYAATQNVSIIGAVSYEIYRKVSRTFGANLSPFFAGSTYSTSVSPRYLTFKVGATYRF